MVGMNPRTMNMKILLIKITVVISVSPAETQQI